MKRKVVVTMSMSYWADDNYYDEAQSEDSLIREAESMDENSLIELCDEFSIIKIEVTETKSE